MSTSFFKHEKRSMGKAEPSTSAKKGSRGPSSSSSGFSPSMAKLPRSTRNTLLGLRTIKDPFDDDTEQAIKDFHDYLLQASPDEINLEECSLLLQASTKIFGMQVKVGAQHVSSLAAFVTNTAKKDDGSNEQAEGEGEGKKKRGRKKKDAEGDATEGVPPSDGPTSSTQATEAGVPSNEPSTSSQAGGENSVASGLNVTGDAGENPANSASETNSGSVTEVVSVVETNCDSERMDSSSTALLESSSQEESSTLQSSLPENQSGVDSTGEASSIPTISDDTGHSMDSCAPMDTDIDSSVPGNGMPAENQADGISALDTSINEQSASSVAVRKSPLKREAKEKGDGTPVKKRKISMVPPPVLISIFDLDDAMSTDDESDDDMPPPVLYPEVDLWDGQFDPSADPDRPVELVKVLETLTLSPKDQNSVAPDTDPTAAAEAAVDGDMAETPDSAPHLESTQESASQSGSGAANEEAQTSQNAKESALTSGESVSTVAVEATPHSSDNSQASGSDPSCSVELPVLTPDDQQEIQNCIYQLHYLPFTCELTKTEMARTFSTTVEHLEKIFKKYNMPFNRNLLKAASVACRDMVSSLSTRPSIDMDERRPDEVESFSQGAAEQTKGAAALNNSEKTILERTKEKSVAESRKTIQKRLEEMQKLIVPKYIQWPLITENTPEFFQRVQQFEQKMKKVLADEEKKETFDVTKYEIEVLNATALEAQEEEAADVEGSEDGRTLSPRSPCPLEDAKIQRMLSPVSLSNGPTFENGRKWVPLSNVFHHMKQFNRNECARHFYAVLALLSSQNLDMNYDRHFSQECAALLTKKIQSPQDPQVVSKYPRGVKIMTSRCPDADKEEIYVTALASKSCNESFRDLINNEMHLNGLPDGNPSSNQRRTERVTSTVSSMSNGEVAAESDEEFVPMGPATFAGNLFGGRKNRKT